jgi:transposase
MARGRPTKLTPERQAAFVAALKRTYFVETAADLAGINRATVYRWLKKGRRARRGACKDFCGAVKKALVEAEADFLDGLRSHGGDAWQVYAWLLERRYPHRWGNQKHLIRQLLKKVTELEKDRTNRPATH